MYALEWVKEGGSATKAGDARDSKPKGKQEIIRAEARPTKNMTRMKKKQATAKE